MYPCLHSPHVEEAVCSRARPCAMLRGSGFLQPLQHPNEDLKSCDNRRGLLTAGFLHLMFGFLESSQGCLKLVGGLWSRSASGDLEHVVLNRPILKSPKLKTPKTLNSLASNASNPQPYKALQSPTSPKTLYQTPGKQPRHGKCGALDGGPGPLPISSKQQPAVSRV